MTGLILLILRFWPLPSCFLVALWISFFFNQYFLFPSQYPLSVSYFLTFRLECNNLTYHNELVGAISDFKPFAVGQRPKQYRVAAFFYKTALNTRRVFYRQTISTVRGWLHERYCVRFHVRFAANRRCDLVSTVASTVQTIGHEIARVISP
jgi:hypothetical protein